MSDTPPGFVEQRLFLPQRLWKRVVELSESSQKEPSEIVADALRALLAGGARATVAAAAATAKPEAAPSAVPGVVETIDPEDAEQVLAQVCNEPIDSSTLREALLQLVRGVEQRDQFPGHGEAVAETARALAERLALEEKEVVAIELAALTHDLDKSRIPAAILGKQGRLTPEEWQLVRRYPEFGAEMLGQCTQLHSVAGMVRHHQERWNGTGYPDALKADQIPVGAQIVGICDVFHVLTSERAYRPALSPDTAQHTIGGGSDRLWSPHLVEVFLEKLVKQ